MPDPMTAVLLSVQTGLPAQRGIPDSTDPLTKPHVTAILKTPVSGPLRLFHNTLEGDGVAYPEFNNKGDRSLCVYPAEHYAYWQEKLGFGARNEFGSFGENFTTQGILEPDLCIGDVFAVGTAVVSVSEPRQPCFTLARYWDLHSFPKLVDQTGFTGWFFRVLQPGVVQAGDALTLAERPFPQWTVARANDVMSGREKSLEALAELAACESLSADWKRQLQKRLDKRIARETPELPGME